MLAKKIALSLIGALLSTLILYLGLATGGIKQAKAANKIASKDIYVLAMGANTHGLTQANNDAKRFAKAMRNKFSIPKKNIKVLTNVSKRGFNKAIEGLAKKRNKKRVYIYFSGHGTRIRGDEHDCFDEALVFNRGYNYRDNKFVKQINSLITKKNKVNLTTILDTCFSGGMTKAYCSRAKAKFIPVKSSCKVRRTAKKLKGVVLTASSENQRAWESPSQGGRFTKELLHFLKKRSSTIVSAFKSAQSRIVKQTQGTGCYQHPQLIY